MCQLGTCPSSVVCRSWSDVASAFAFLSQTCTRQSELAAREAGGERASAEQSMRICFQLFICFQIACMMLLTAVPLDWFACLLFVFISFLVLTWSLCFICLQNSCMMLLTVVPLIWFACLLFVFFSERFPFICRAGLCWRPSWLIFRRSFQGLFYMPVQVAP